MRVFSSVYVHEYEDSLILHGVFSRNSLSFYKWVKCVQYVNEIGMLMLNLHQALMDILDFLSAYIHVYI